MATEPTVMKMRLAEINRYINGVNTIIKKDMSLEEKNFYWGRVDVVDGVRQIMGRMPKGYSKEEPSLKNRAKERYLMWRENQAKGDWKKLSDSERAIWEGYVEDGLEFGAIREKELERGNPIKVGDRLELVKDIWFLGNQYRPGLIGEVSGFSHYEDTEVVAGYALTFNGTGLPPVNAYPHEVKKASNV